ncbi:hypothetical protein HAX54_038004 [Datura stramonium]|uniref:Uncharacterized protein n=1 Tax=Datura stramonium TaxID=4076 RepID=A0ABS8SHQ4_DATST|nr:hypothetical protein [Datura stramonium]
MNSGEQTQPQPATTTNSKPAPPTSFPFSPSLLRQPPRAAADTQNLPFSLPSLLTTPNRRQTFPFLSFRRNHPFSLSSHSRPTSLILPQRRSLSFHFLLRRSASIV